jgi:hypothetical protein
MKKENTYRMCPGVGCPLKETCVRFQADDTKLTSSDFFGTPFDNFTNKCKYYKNK